MQHAAIMPPQICELAGQTATLAARLATDGDPNLRGDAITAALLAEAAARSAASLVRINIAADVADARPSPRAASQDRAVFVNRVGAKGELVFWGGSHLVDPGGRTVAVASLYTE